MHGNGDKDGHGDGEEEVIDGCRATGGLYCTIARPGSRPPAAQQPSSPAVPSGCIFAWVPVAPFRPGRLHRHSCADEDRPLPQERCFTNAQFTPSRPAQLALLFIYPVLLPPFPSSLLLCLSFPLSRFFSSVSYNCGPNCLFSSLDILLLLAPQLSLPPHSLRGAQLLTPDGSRC